MLWDPNAPRTVLSFSELSYKPQELVSHLQTASPSPASKGPVEKTRALVFPLPGPYWKGGLPFLPLLEAQRKEQSPTFVSRPQMMSLRDCPVLWDRNDFPLSSSKAVFSLSWLGISGCYLYFKCNTQVYTRSKLSLVPLATALTFIACPSSFWRNLQISW